MGNITELSCILAFTAAGYQVSLPYGGQARYDFLVDINGKILRVQVKTATVSDNQEYIKFDCRNSAYKQGHHVHKTYSEDEIDYFATFYNGVCYLVPISECSAEKRLRFIPPKNNQTVGINFAKDYELKEVLNRIV